MTLSQIAALINYYVGTSQDCDCGDFAYLLKYEFIEKIVGCDRKQVITVTEKGAVLCEAIRALQHPVPKTMWVMP